MRFLPIVAAYLILCISASAQAKKYAYNFAGIDATDPKMFINPMETENTILTASGWKTQLFSGDNFNSKSFDQITKEANAGDQVLITIDTHGLPDGHSQGHLITCGNQTCDTGELQKTIQALEAKKVQVAVVDLSCYSGLSQNLKTSKTCIVSGASDNDTAWHVFPTNFATNISPGRSLEETFLKARLMKTSLGLPQISTRAGQYTDSLIQELAEHPTMNVKAEDLAKEPCATLDLHQLTDSFRDINDVTGKLQASAYVLAVANYKSIYRQAQDLAKEMMKTGTTKAKSDLGLTYTWQQLADDDDRWLQINIPSAYQLKQSLKNNPDFQKFLLLHKKFYDLTNSADVTLSGKASSPLAEAALQVQQAEKPLYDRIYKANRTLDRNGDACAKFIF